MIDFIQPNANPEPDISLTAESIFVDDIALENSVDGFRVLTVSGREFVDKLAIVQSIDGKDGSLFIGSRQGSRVLEVRYLLNAESDTDFREKFNTLNGILQQGMMKISFNDEPDYYFNAIFSDGKSVPQGRNSIVSSFTLFCPDPYKYKDLPVVSGASVTAGLGAWFPYKINEIKTIMSAAHDGFMIKNTTSGRKIKLLGNFTAGQQLVIRDQEILLNGNPIMDRLDFVSSDWGKFIINAGDEITADEILHVKLAERAL